MRYFLVIPLLSVALFSWSKTSAQEIRFNRYAQLWVDGGIDREEKQIIDNESFAHLKKSGIQFFIPESHNLSLPNGQFIEAYLINFTKSSVEIDRADATITGVQTQIKVDGKWKLLQQNRNSDCGNSYFKQTLAPGKYWSLKLENEITGNRVVPYRISITVNGKKLISNEINVYVSDLMITTAGTPIKPLI